MANPVASLISVPFDYESDIGPTDSGERWSVTTKPVIPGLGNQSGLSDLQMSFFFSPKEPVGGFIIGIAPGIHE